MNAGKWALFHKKMSLCGKIVPDETVPVGPFAVFLHFKQLQG